MRACLENPVTTPRQLVCHRADSDLSIENSVFAGHGGSLYYTQCGSVDDEHEWLFDSQLVGRIK